MRKANVNDMFAVARFIKKLGIREKIFEAQKGKEDLDKIGFDLVFDILEASTTQNVQDELYLLLSGPFEMKPEEIGLMELDKFTEAVTDCFNMKTLKNFISRVSPLVTA